MSRRSQSRGFTLVEMLVVFAIFAVIGVVTAQILGRAIDNQQMLAKRTSRLVEVERAMQMLQRDILQASPRGIRDMLGDPLPAIVVDADGLLEFTRLGWRNPLQRRRSNLQRVGYVLDGEDLYRIYWPVLDRAPDTEPLRQLLLEDVERVEFVAIDRAGNEYAFWPTERGTFPDSVDPAQPPDQQPPQQVLAAILVRINLTPFGEVERLWPVPGA